MSDIHPLSGSSYPDMAQSNPLDVNNHPDTMLPDSGSMLNSDGTANRNSFAGQYLESRSARPMMDSMKFGAALNKLGSKK